MPARRRPSVGLWSARGRTRAGRRRYGRVDRLRRPPAVGASGDSGRRRRVAGLGVAGRRGWTGAGHPVVRLRSADDPATRRVGQGVRRLPWTDVGTGAPGAPGCWAPAGAPDGLRRRGRARRLCVRLRPGQRLRLSARGRTGPTPWTPGDAGHADRPPAVEPWSFPAVGRVRHRTLPPEFVPGAEVSTEDPAGVIWRVERDMLESSQDGVLGRRLRCSTFAVPGGEATDRYSGRVSVYTSHLRPARRRPWPTTASRGPTWWPAPARPSMSASDRTPTTSSSRSRPARTDPASPAPARWWASAGGSAGYPGDHSPLSA